MPCSSNEPGCGASSREIHGSLAGRRAEGKKSFICVTTRGRNFGVYNGLGHDFDLLTALLLCLSVLSSDIVILATFGLATRRLPATNLPQALRLLAVALVPAPRLIPAPTSFAQTRPQTGSACSS